MMLTGLLGGLISLIWIGVGTAMIALPAWWQVWVRRTMADPLGRLLIAQGLILAGLLLFLGTAPLRGYGLWMAVGSLAVAKGLLWLGLSAAWRDRLLDGWGTWPSWSHRLAGVFLLVLATLLVIDTLQTAL